MKSRLLILLLLFTALSCEYNDSGVCGGDGEYPQWVRDQIATLENSEFSRHYSYVEQAYYEGQPVFYVSGCCAFCLIVITYRDCAGNEVENVDTSKLKNPRRIWVAEENECLFM